MAEPPVADASPVIVLAQAGQLDLLRTAGDRLILPRAVMTEIEQPGLHDVAAEAIHSASWIDVLDAGSPLSIVQSARIGRGEAAGLTWALHHPGTVAIIDDLRGRRAATALGVPIIGTLGILISATLQGMIPAARPIVE